MIVEYSRLGAVWDEECMSANLKRLDDRVSLECIKDSPFCTALLDVCWTCGLCSFSVEIIDDAGTIGNRIAVGVVSKWDEHIDWGRAIGSTMGGCGYWQCQKKNLTGIPSMPMIPYGEPFTTGDTITCECDLTAETVVYYKNGKCLGVAMSGLKAPVRPGVTLWSLGAIVRLVEIIM